MARYKLCDQLVVFIDLDTKTFVRGILKRGSNDPAEELSAIDVLCVEQWHGSTVDHPRMHSFANWGNIYVYVFRHFISF